MSAPDEYLNEILAKFSSLMSRKHHLDETQQAELKMITKLVFLRAGLFYVGTVVLATISLIVSVRIFSNIDNRYVRVVMFIIPGLFFMAIMHLVEKHFRRKILRGKNSDLEDY